VYREGATWAESADQVRKSGDLGARPLIVLTGARGYDAELRTLWADGLQAGMARLSSRGKQVVLNNSGHGIMLDDPNAAADAIQQICQAVHELPYAVRGTSKKDSSVSQNLLYHHGDDHRTVLTAASESPVLFFQ